jgi:hypothetical protein
MAFQKAIIAKVLEVGFTLGERSPGYKVLD